MPRYFFDVHDSAPLPLDDVGTDCADRQEIRRVAMRLLPDLAREEVPDGDRRTFSLIVSDERGHAVFSVVLSLVGQWLDDRPTVRERDRMRVGDGPAASDDGPR